MLPYKSEKILMQDKNNPNLMWLSISAFKIEDKGKFLRIPLLIHKELRELLDMNLKYSFKLSAVTPSSYGLILCTSLIA